MKFSYQKYSFIDAYKSNSKYNKLSTAVNNFIQEYKEYTFKDSMMQNLMVYIKSKSFLDQERTVRFAIDLKKCNNEDKFVLELANDLYKNVIVSYDAYARQNSHVRHDEDKITTMQDFIKDNNSWK